MIYQTTQVSVRLRPSQRLAGAKMGHRSLTSATCQRTGLTCAVVVERPREDWTYRVLKLRSPDGMEVLLEEQDAS
jgi:hypothetical protein